MNNHLLIRIFTLIIFVSVLGGCQKFKEDFLNVKRDPSIVTPQSIADYQALLDNSTNGLAFDPFFNISSSHTLGVVGSDELAIFDGVLPALPANYAHEKNAYTWEENFNNYKYDPVYDDWANGYKRIFYSNLILEGIDRIVPTEVEKDAWMLVKGSALFFRALNLFDLAQQYAPAYQLETANTDLGVPIRLDYDINIKSVRATVQQNYDRIATDLEDALALLPLQSENKFRPSKLAVYFLLAKLYLQMDRFDESLQNAKLALNIHNQLVDYSTIDTLNPFSFTADYGQTNPEVIFYTAVNPFLSRHTYGHINPQLLEQYEADDLRKYVYFKSTANDFVVFKGSYSGGESLFTGFATDELWLMLAETYARTGNVEDGLEALNHLLSHRYENFTAWTTSDQMSLLNLIIQNRRKELVLRGVRWGDIRRYAKEDAWKVTLVRQVDGKTYRLEPGDLRYVWPIPRIEIDINNMEQNPR